MQGKHIDQRIQPILIEQQQADDHHTAGQEVGNIKFQTVHYKLRETNSNRAPSSPSISAAPRN